MKMNSLGTMQTEIFESDCRLAVECSSSPAAMAHYSSTIQDKGVPVNVGGRIQILPSGGATSAAMKSNGLLQDPNNWLNYCLSRVKNPAVDDTRWPGQGTTPNPPQYLESRSHDSISAMALNLALAAKGSDADQVLILRY
jgi:hypothetical protein